MHPFAAVFLAALLLATALRLWLAWRHMRHVAAHRGAVPPVFAVSIALEAHQKAADYTVAKTRLGMVDILIGAALLLALTLGGGLQALAIFWGGIFAPDGYAYGIALVA